MKYICLLIMFIIYLIKPCSINAQELAVEKRLKEINITLTEVPNHTEQVREWLSIDEAHKILAEKIFEVIGNNKIIDPIPLEVINGKFKILMNKKPNDYITSDYYSNKPELIKKAIYNTWKERHPDSSKKNFENILISQVIDIPETNYDDIVVIEINYPQKKDKISRPEFVGSGKIISKIIQNENTYIYSLIKTDKYYRQESKKLKFHLSGNVWAADWSLNLILGRKEDIGLTGKLYIFVVDQTNREKLIKYYIEPQLNRHSDTDIPNIANIDFQIERSIPD